MHSLRHLSRQLNGFGKTRSPDPPPVTARHSRPTSLLCPCPPAPRPEPSHLIRLVCLVCSKLSAAWAALRSRPDSSHPVPFDSARRSHFGLKTLVLDLDETLIHSTSRPIPSRTSFFPTTTIPSPVHTVDVILAGRHTQYHVYKRPFVDFFLRTVSGWYTLVIFTASMKEYADPVIDWLDAGRGILVQRLFRDSCTQLPNGSYTKDLSIIEQDLSRVCLVDNSPISYNVNQANGIPIEGWTDDPSDQALLDLLPVLDSLRFTKDVRHILGLRSAGLCPS